MSRRHNPAVYDPVVKVTPQEAERNKRAMGKREAAHEDPRGVDYTIAQPPAEEPDEASATDSKDDPKVTDNDK